MGSEDFFLGPGLVKPCWTYIGIIYLYNSYRHLGLRKKKQVDYFMLRLRGNLQDS